MCRRALCARDASLLPQWKMWWRSASPAVGEGIMNRTDGTAGTDASAPLQGDVESGSGSLSAGGVDARRSGESSGHHTRCPICGLALQVVSRGAVLELHYDFAVWDRACKTPDLGGPSICL